MVRSAQPNRASRSSARPEPAEAALHQLLRTHGRLRQVQDPYFARFGISAAQWGILRTLQRAEGEGEMELRLTDLGRRQFTQPPGMTGLIDRMERDGLVRRAPSAADRRARCVRLTPAGRRLLAEVLGGHAAQIRALCAGLSETELTQLHRLLARWHEHLRTLCPDGQAAAVSRVNGQPRRGRAKI